MLVTYVYATFPSCNCCNDTSNKCYTVFLLFQGLIAVGGFERMWRISEAGGRIIFFKYVSSADFILIWSAAHNTTDSSSSSLHFVLQVNFR